MEFPHFLLERDLVIARGAKPSSLVVFWVLPIKTGYFNISGQRLMDPWLMKIMATEPEKVYRVKSRAHHHFFWLIAGKKVQEQTNKTASAALNLHSETPLYVARGLGSFYWKRESKTRHPLKKQS